MSQSIFGDLVTCVLLQIRAKIKIKTADKHTGYIVKGIHFLLFYFYRLFDQVYKQQQQS